MGDCRYRAKEFGLDSTDNGTWIAAFPDGPFMEINEVSLAIVDIVAASRTPLTVEAVTSDLRAVIEGMPIDADAHIGKALDLFVEANLLERVEVMQ